MTLPMWQIDAFAHRPFAGNPAAVCVHEQPLDDALMQAIAAEMNLSETAFVWQRDGQLPMLRWFTPTCEVDLCGHATLSAAHVLFHELGHETSAIRFQTRYVGELSVSQDVKTLHYCLHFPVRAGQQVPVHTIKPNLLQALGLNAPITAARQARDLMLVIEDTAQLRALSPDFHRLASLQTDVIVTAPSDVAEYDFISRYFCAGCGISEDPVTGSAHCTLAPYWAQRLGKQQMRAYQASRRGGVLQLALEPDAVHITGQAITVMQGQLYLP